MNTPHDPEHADEPEVPNDRQTPAGPRHPSDAAGAQMRVNEGSSDPVIGGTVGAGNSAPQRSATTSLDQRQSRGVHASSIDVPPASPLPPLGPPVEADAVSRSTRRSFIGFGIAAATGAAGLTWLYRTGSVQNARWPLRKGLQVNEKLIGAYYNPARRMAEVPYGSAPTGPRTNGSYGLGSAVDVDAWRMRVTGLAAGDGTADISLADLKKLPETKLATRLCCIEGWSIFVNWSGVSFRDFIQAYPPSPAGGKTLDVDRPESFLPYVAMSTPDRAYYVGLDIASCLQSQAMLCWAIDGQPLSRAHGAPLRLVVPTKYGVKNIKRIGHVDYTAERPADYWAERGYDWFCGL